MDDVSTEHMSKRAPQRALEVRHHLTESVIGNEALDLVEDSAVVALTTLRHQHETQRYVLHCASSLHESVHRQQLLERSANHLERAIDIPSFGTS